MGDRQGSAKPEFRVSKSRWRRSRRWVEPQALALRAPLMSVA